MTSIRRQDKPHIKVYRWGCHKGNNFVSLSFLYPSHLMFCEDSVIASSCGGVFNNDTDMAWVSRRHAATGGLPAEAHILHALKLNLNPENTPSQSSISNYSFNAHTQTRTQTVCMDGINTKHTLPTDIHTHTKTQTHTHTTHIHTHTHTSE